MARAAVLGRLIWQVANLAAVRDETPTARTLVFDVADWPGHRAGQHVDVRLTAPDGYSTQRSYSIASAVAGERIELTVQTLADGEVSPYLSGVLSVGDQIELRGPIGGWFVWDAARTEPVLLVAGGSGVVPLMAMIRSRAAERARVPFQLLYSVRDLDATLFRDELEQRARDEDGLDVEFLYTRAAPAGSRRPPGRLDAEFVADVAMRPASGALVFVCGPTGFVEAAANLLVEAGYDPARIKTERFGPSGGEQ
jgi:ferredoxin-NADP reductase